MSQTISSEERALQGTKANLIIAPQQVAIAQPRNRVQAIALNSIQDIVEFAGHAARTDMVPKDFKGKPEAIVIAVMFGAELGLPPIQALQSIAVVNGRPSVWGDAVPGLCYASGLCQDIVEYFEGKEGEPDFTAVCIVTRRGASPKTGKFSLHDAAVAGLRGNSTHSKYPKRMLQWRARSYACHDAFPDVLRGIGTVEIEQEIESTASSWIMPQPERSWFASQAQSSGGWDAAWFNEAQDKLMAEQNAWLWIGKLKMLLDDAPTLTDVEEIAGLDVVSKAFASAPAEAKEMMTAAFDKARARFASQKSGAVHGKVTDAEVVRDTVSAFDAQTGEIVPETEREPQQASAPPPAQVAPPPTASPPVTVPPAFDHGLCDCQGELAEDLGIGGYFTDPLEWAKAFTELVAAGEDVAALLEHNADAILEACAISPAATGHIEAAHDIANKRAAGEDVRSPYPDVPLKSNRPDLPAWLDTCRRSFMAAGPDGIEALWRDVEAKSAKIPPATRKGVAAAYANRKTVLGLDTPPAAATPQDTAPGLSSADPEPTASTPAQTAPAASSDLPTAGPTPDQDRAARIADELIDDIHGITDAYALDQYGKNAAVKAKLGQLLASAPDLHARVVAVAKRHRENLTTTG